MATNDPNSWNSAPGGDLQPTDADQLQVYRIVQGLQGGGEERPSGGFEISKRNVLYIVFRHKLKILLSFAVLTLASVLFVSAQPNLYLSEARVLMSGIRSSLAIQPTGGEDSMLKSIPGGASFQQEAGILTSELLAERVLDRIGTTEFLMGYVPRDARMTSSSESMLLAMPGLTEDSTPKRKGLKRRIGELLNFVPDRIDPERLAVRVLLDSLDLGETMHRSGVLQLTFKAPEAEFARDTLNTIVEEYLKLHTEVHQNQLPPGFFESKLEEAQTNLQLKTNEINSFKQQHGITAPLEEQGLLLERIEDLERALSDLTWEKDLSAARIAIYDKYLPQRVNPAAPEGEPNVEIVPIDPLVERLSGQLTELQIQLAELKIRFTEKHPQVVALQDRIHGLEQVIREAQAARTAPAETGHSIVRPLRTVTDAGPTMEFQLQRESEMVRLDSFRLREQRLVQDIDHAREQLTAISEHGRQLRELQRDLTVLEQEYLQYANSKQVAELSSLLDKDRVINLSVVQRASLPTSSQKNRRKMLALLFFGSFMGLAGGAGLAFALEFANTSLKTDGDVLRHLDLPVLVSIPVNRKHIPHLKGVSDG